jgi:hypothetical protein
MPSTYTTNGGIELIATGEQSGTWGDTTNDNLEIIDRLTNGVGAITLSGTTHTLTTTDGTLSDGQYRVLVFGGTPSGTNTVTISPNTGQHLYFVKNGSGQSVVLTQGSGGNVTVANGKSAIVYTDGAGSGAAAVDLTSTFNFQAASATLAAIAALAVTDSNIIVGNGTTWVAESGATARTSLGLGSIATQAASNVSITGGSLSGLTAVTAGQIDITAQGDLRLQDTTGGEYVALQAPGTVSASYTLTLPAADGTANQFLKTDGSGSLSFTNTLVDPAITGTILEDIYTISDGAAFEVDPSNGSIQLITLGASRTPKATNFAAGEAVTLMVDDGTAYTLTWTDATWGGSGVVWKTDGGVAPTLNTSGYTVITLWKVSTQVYGARVGDA